MKIYSKIINKNDLCFDIGANKGNKTQDMLNFGAKVISVEPQVKCQEHLKERFNKNNNVKIINKAIGDKPGIGKIFISNAHTLSTMSREFILETKKERFSDVDWIRKQSIEIITLDELISNYGIPKYCKIDVEGYEKEVLKGLSTQIEYISIEFTPELKSNTFECMEILKKLGNYKYNYTEQETGEFSFENWICEKDMIDFLSKNNDFKISFGDLYAKLF